MKIRIHTHKTITESKSYEIQEITQVPVWIKTLSSKCDLCGFELWERETKTITAILTSANHRAFIHNSCVSRLIKSEET